MCKNFFRLIPKKKYEETGCPRFQGGNVRGGNAGKELQIGCAQRLKNFNVYTFIGNP